MFKVKCTGKNLNYGKKGQVRNLSDYHVLTSLRNGWIEKDVEFLGNKGKPFDVPIVQEGYIVKRINVENLIKQQNKALIRIIKDIDFFKNKSQEISLLISNSKSKTL